MKTTKEIQSLKIGMTSYGPGRKWAMKAIRGGGIRSTSADLEDFELLPPFYFLSLGLSLGEWIIQIYNYSPQALCIRCSVVPDSSISIYRFF